MFFISLFYYFISAAQDSEHNQTLNPFQTLNLRTVLERKRRSFETHNSTPPFLWFFSPSMMTQTTMAMSFTIHFKKSLEKKFEYDDSNLGK